MPQGRLEEAGAKWPRPKHLTIVGSATPKASGRANLISAPKDVSVLLQRYGNCVEVAVRIGAVLVRDSKDTDRQALAVSRDAWSAFTTLAADWRV